MRYSWQILSPAGATGLSNGTSNPATFTPAAAGSYLIRCTVRDSVPGLCFAADEIEVNVLGLTVNVQSPIVGCIGMPTLPLGGDPTASGGRPPYTYAWSMISGPGGDFESGVKGSSNPTLKPLHTGTYVAQVRVSDSSSPPLSITKTVSIAVGQPPSESAGDVETYHPIIMVGDSLQLGGSPSASGGHAPYTYEWSIPTNPGRAGVISDPASSNPVFVGQEKGAYVVQLRITDAGGFTSETHFGVTVVTDPPASALPSGATNPSACGATCGPTGLLTVGVLLTGFACVYAGRR